MASQWLTQYVDKNNDGVITFKEYKKFLDWLKDMK